LKEKGKKLEKKFRGQLKRLDGKNTKRPCTERAGFVQGTHQNLSKRMAKRSISKTKKQWEWGGGTVGRLKQGEQEKSPFVNKVAGASTQRRRVALRLTGTQQQPHKSNLLRMKTTPLHKNASKTMS